MTTTIAPVQTITFEINEGPSTDRLIDALKYAFDPQSEVSVVFKGYARIADGTACYMEYDAQITGVAYENGTCGVFSLAVNIAGFQTSTAHYDARSRNASMALIHRPR